MNWGVLGGSGISNAEVFGTGDEQLFFDIETMVPLAGVRVMWIEGSVKWRLRVVALRIDANDRRERRRWTPGLSTMVGIGSNWLLFS